MLLGRNSTPPNGYNEKKKGWLVGAIWNEPIMFHSTTTDPVHLLTLENVMTCKWVRGNFATYPKQTKRKMNKKTMSIAKEFRFLVDCQWPRSYTHTVTPSDTKYPDRINPNRKTTAFQLTENKPKLGDCEHQLQSNNNMQSGRMSTGYVMRITDGWG